MLTAGGTRRRAGGQTLAVTRRRIETPITGFGSVGVGGPEVGFCRSGPRCLEGVGGRLVSVLYWQVRPRCAVQGSFEVAALDGKRSPQAVTAHCPVMAASRSLRSPTV